MSSGWRRCRKVKTAFVREVMGDRERVDTREGITWAYAQTDFVMCGADENGEPKLSDRYPIKKSVFNEYYEIIAEETPTKFPMNWRLKKSNMLHTVKESLKWLGIVMLYQDWRFNLPKESGIFGPIKDEPGYPFAPKRCWRANWYESRIQSAEYDAGVGC